MIGEMSLVLFLPKQESGISVKKNAPGGVLRVQV